MSFCKATIQLDYRAENLMLLFCLPGFAWRGETRGMGYYWPKFPWSDIVFFAQAREGMESALFSPEHVKALQRITFCGRGGRLPLQAFKIPIKKDTYGKLAALDQALITNDRLPISKLWNGDPHHN